MQSLLCHFLVNCLFLSHFLFPPVAFESLFVTSGPTPRVAFESLVRYLKFSGFRGKKSVHHHPGTPPLSVCRPTLRSQSKQAMAHTICLGTMVNTISLGKQGKMVYTICPERRAYTTEAPDPKRRKKGGLPRWWCIHFSSLFWLASHITILVMPPKSGFLLGIVA